MTRKRSLGYRAKKEQDKHRKKLKRLTLELPCAKNAATTSTANSPLQSASVLSSHEPSETTTTKPIQCKMASPQPPITSQEHPQIAESSQTTQCIPEILGVHEESFHGVAPEDVLTGDLSIQVMDYVSLLLKQQFPSSCGLVPPSALYSLELAKKQDPSIKLDREMPAVQIHFVSNHFLVSAQVNRHLHVFDSLYNVAHLQALRPQLDLVYSDLNTRNINYCIPQSQGFTNLCGLFAIANALILLGNRLPACTHFDTNRMREHLYECIRNGFIDDFPTTPVHFHRLHHSSTHDRVIPVQHTSDQMICENNNDSGKQNSTIKTKQQKDKIRKQQLRQNDSYKKTEQAHDRIRKQQKRKNRLYKQKEQLENTNNKQKQRANMEQRTLERDREKQCKQKTRQNPEIRAIEREKEKLCKQKTRQDSEKRSNEREKEKLCKQKSRQDREKRSNEREKEKLCKQKSRQDTGKRINEREKEKLCKQKSRQDTEKRSNEREKEKLCKQKSRQDTEKRSNEREKEKLCKQKFRQDTEKRSNERVKEKLCKQKSRQDTEKRSNEREKEKLSKQKSRQDTEKRSNERVKEKLSKQKSRQDTEKWSNEREKQKLYKQKSRQDTERRNYEKEKEKLCKQKSRQYSDRRISEQEKQKLYRQNTRQDLKRRSAERQKEILYKQKSRQHRQTRNSERKRDRLYKARARQNPAKRNKERAILRKKQDQLQNIQNVITVFNQQCKQLPIFTCAVCLRLLFKKQVKMLKLAKYCNTEIITHCITINSMHIPETSCDTDCYDCAKWICFTCDRQLLAGNIPKQATSNNIILPQQPTCLTELNQLEKHLVSPVIPFMKILPLPKGQQKGVFGPVVCVPSNMSTVTQILPRNVSDSSLIKVKLKRKLEYKGHHLFQQVSMSRLKAALQFLKNINPHFNDVTLDMDILDLDEEPGLVLNDAHENTIPCIVPPKSTENTQDTDIPDIIAISHTEDPVTQSDQNKSTSPDITETSAPMITCLQQESPDQHISLAPAQGQTPGKVLEMETKAFPYLFPDGKNGYCEERNNKIGLSRYFNSRLFNRDTRFASDPQYIFFSQFVTEMNNINSSVSIAIRKGAKPATGKDKITASMITDHSQRNVILNSDKGYHFLRTVRGSPAYWEKTLKDLLAMVKQLGLPTWFCSFSAADRRWPEIVDAICYQQGKSVPEHLDWTQYCQLINSNPVTACRMFENRVNAFISTVIMSNAKPIGAVKDYFIRTEFQSRGWPHIHCLFWCSDAPIFQKNDPNNQTFINYINTYITCTLPNQQEDPVLHELVTSVQLHSQNHSKTCRKGAKQCRFNFPRPVSTKTFIAVPTPPPDNVLPATYKQNALELLSSVYDSIQEVQDQITVENLFNKKSLTQQKYEDAHSAVASRSTVIFKREIADMWVNPYNAHLLKAWNGNIDIQPVLDPYSCIMYIVSYISKAERELGDILRKAQEEAEEGNTDPVKQLRKLGNVYINAREICIMEAVYRVCSMKLKNCTREVVFVPADRNSARLTKPIKVLKQSNPTDDNIWMTNIIDRYLSRPKTQEFENMTLAHFASNYKVKDRTTPCNDDDQEENVSNQYYTLQNNMGSILLRKTPAIIRYTNYNKDKHSENYYYNLIAMYYPYRNQDFKLPHINTYEQMFHESSYIILPNMQNFEQLTEELDAAWIHLQNNTDQEDAWASIASNQEVQRLEDQEQLHATVQDMITNSHPIDPSDIPDFSLDTTTSVPQHAHGIVQTTQRPTKHEHLQRLQSLNEKQSQLFHFVKSWAERQEHQSADPFYIFLTGGAGTGKSHTIKCIFNEVDRTLSRQSENADSPVVLLVAYTGTAAFNIGGLTIHSAFTVNKNMSPQLAEESANTLRARLQDLQLLIIDEVSMVSTRLLTIIHSRLQQVKKPSNPNSFFGNVSVLAVGDFHQIPPISGKSLISTNNTLTDLWSLFCVWTLTEVVRQKGDNQFIAMLNRIRVRLREEPLASEDITFLNSKIINQDNPNYPENVLHIASLHQQLDKYNNIYMERLSQHQTVYEIHAVDIYHDKKNHRSYKRTEALIVKDATLKETLKVSVNARIMLTMNLNVTDGLTNGAIGTITAIIQGHKPLNQPAAICVLFDCEKIGIQSRNKSQPPPTVNPRSTVITPQTEVIKSGTHPVTRHQYPFILAWAVTIHKIQGITTDKAIVSLKGIFKPGMAYVALSRVTSGAGLYLLQDDFDTHQIYCDPKVNKQLEKMPNAATLPHWHNVSPQLSSDPNQILIASHNCEGYFPHFHDIKRNTFLLKADIIALQETWTKSNDTIRPPTPRFNAHFSHRPTHSTQQTARGGVGLFVHEDFNFVCLDTTAADIECVAVHITAPPFNILNVYKPPQLDLQYFCQQLSKLLDSLPPSPTVVLGDFNAQASSPELQDTFSTYVQLIDRPTTKRQTLIDHIYVKDLTVIQSGTVPTYYSYHCVTYVSFKSQDTLPH